MYITIVVLMTMILPIASTAIAVADGADPAEAAAQWFAFWSVGMRLALAGLSQTLQPRYTSQTLFAIADPKAHALVREIGFGNLALATLGIGSLAFPGWVVPAAMAGAVFYALAGIAHLLARRRTRERMAAMVTDLAVAAALAAALVGMRVT